jgi:hypothetical protein
MESADKPGSVVDSHSSRARVTARFKRPTRERCGHTPLLPYSVLLQVGFTLPLMLPPARCALTAPFHPYPAAIPGNPAFATQTQDERIDSEDSDGAVYFLWHFPSAHAAQALPGTLPCGARTFLPVSPEGDIRRLSGRLLIQRYKIQRLKDIKIDPTHSWRVSWIAAW